MADGIFHAEVVDWCRRRQCRVNGNVAETSVRPESVIEVDPPGRGYGAGEPHDYATVRALEAGLAKFFRFYSDGRVNTAMDYLTPAMVYAAA